MKQKLAFFLATTSLVYSFAGTAYAAEYTMPFQLTQTSNNDASTRSATGVAVFVGSLLVAMIVDGVLIFTTGQSGGEWVATALDYYEDHSVDFENGNMTSIHISSDGTVHGGNGREF